MLLDIGMNVTYLTKKTHPEQQGFLQFNFFIVENLLF